MVEFIKKNKKIILNSSIFIGISNLNNNIFGESNENPSRKSGGCCANCKKADKNKTTETSNQNQTVEEIPNKNHLKDQNQDKKEEEEEEKKDDKEEEKEEKEKNETPTVDPLKEQKDILITLYNSNIEENNKLEEKDRIEIGTDITPEIINSKNEKRELDNIENTLNDIKNKITEKITEKNKEILRNECITLFDNCENLNNDLGNDKKIDLENTKKTIEDEQNIDNLNIIKVNLNNKKTEIEKIIDGLKENLIKECKALNKKLKKDVIQNFYENEVLKIEYDDEINKDKTLKELNNIKLELEYILNDNILNSEVIEEKEYQTIYYDEIKKCLGSDNIYRIMNIFYLFISNNLPGYYIIVKNKEDISCPFGEEKIFLFSKIFPVINYLLKKDEFFNDKFKSLVKKIDGNSYFLNCFKSYFFENDKKKECYDMEKFNKETVSIILDFKDTDENKGEKQTEKAKLLKEHKITLGDKLKDEDLLYYKFIPLEELNGQVYKKTEAKYLDFF